MIPGQLPRHVVLRPKSKFPSVRSLAVVLTISECVSSDWKAQVPVAETHRGESGANQSILAVVYGIAY